MPTKMQFLRNRFEEEKCHLSDEVIGQFADLILGTNCGWRHNGFMNYARILVPNIVHLLKEKPIEEVLKMSFVELYNIKRPTE